MALPLVPGRSCSSDETPGMKPTEEMEPVLSLPAPAPALALVPGLAAVLPRLAAEAVAGVAGSGEAVGARLPAAVPVSPGIILRKSSREIFPSPSKSADWISVCREGRVEKMEEKRQEDRKDGKQRLNRGKTNCTKCQSGSKPQRALTCMS